MGKPFEVQIGPFGGMKVSGFSAYSGPNEATLSAGIDFTDGTLRGLYLPGDVAQAGIAAGNTFIHHKDGVGWRTTLYKNNACFDGTCSTGQIGVSYYTNVGVSGPAQSLVSAGVNWTDKVLGIAAPVSLSVVDGSGSSRAYRVTHVYQLADFNVTWESNPSPVAVTAGSTGAVLTFPACGASPTGATYLTRIYASTIGDPLNLPPFEWLTDVAGTATSFTDAPYGPQVPAVLLNWDVGAIKRSATSTPNSYQFDNSPSPNLYVLSNALLGVPATANGVTTGAYGGARAGILMGGNYSTLHWAQTGKPWCWPLLNAEDLDDIIEAIIISRAVAYVFTRSGVYAVSGYDDQNLTITRTASPWGALPQSGPAIVQTPYGITFPCRDGIAMFNGLTSTLISAELIPPGSIYSSGNIIIGAYQDGIYLITQPAFAWPLGGLGFDLRKWPEVNLTTVNGLAGYTAMCKTQPHATGLDPNGLYVLDGTNIKPWSPVQGGHNATRDPAFSHLTGFITGGNLTNKKRFTRVRRAFRGTPGDLTAKTYNWDGTLVATTAGIDDHGQLSQAHQGDYMTLTFTGGAANTQFIAARVLGEELG